jgi:transcriptional regulator CtsR
LFIIEIVKESQSQENVKMMVGNNCEAAGGTKMRNISDIIERHIKNILHESPDRVVEIQRNDLADQFRCVPSQINYVISTRFTIEKGYLVQSKRGGGGYIRIQKMSLPSQKDLPGHIFRTIGDRIDQTAAEGLIYQLEEAKVITEREAKLFRAVVSRDSLPFKLPLRDEVRAKLLKSMLASILAK